MKGFEMLFKSIGLDPVDITKKAETVGKEVKRFSDELAEVNRKLTLIMRKLEIQDIKASPEIIEHERTGTNG